MHIASRLGLLIILICASSLHAQVSGGTIFGTVTDPSQAAVVHASVEIRNANTNLVHHVDTNGSGFYSVPNLVPGPYELRVTSAGFAVSLHKGLSLTVGGALEVNVQLRIGSDVQTVEIRGEPAAIDTTTATLSGVVNENTVHELPLNARDWTALATLEPGVVTIRTQPALTITNNRPIRGLGTQLTVGGNRPTQNNYRVDGVSINDYSNGAPGSVLGVDLGVDAIQEFSVITSNAEADYGKSSGGIINAVTKFALKLLW